MSTNPLLLQKQLRENAANLQDFAKDLKSWGEEMKRKESGVKEVSMKRKIKKTTDNNKLHDKAKQPITKVGVTDYTAWDKFDVDAELEKLEDDINDDSELTDECNDNVYDQAIVEKDKGNKFFKLQNWDDAIKCYSKAIEYYSYDPIFYANRALCYLKKGMYEDAEKDCNLSLKLDQTYVKALQRRAAARIEMQKFEHAENDLLKVLEYEPRNVESKGELQKLRSKMNKKEETPTERRPVSKFTLARNKSKASEVYKPPITTLSEKCEKIESVNELEKNKIHSEPSSSWPTQEDIILVKPINKKPHLRSQKPLVRIKIKEVYDGKEITQSTNNEENKTQDENPESDKTWPQPNKKILSINSDDLKIVEKKNEKEKKNNSNHNLLSKPKERSDPCKWEIPKTSVQFYSSWKNFKDSKDKYKFLKLIDPQELPNIFLHSLGSEVFSEILETLAENCTENKDLVGNILQNLINVKRFSTIIMFMTVNDKKNLWKLFDHIKETNELSKATVDQLIQKYEL